MAFTRLHSYQLEQSGAVSTEVLTWDGTNFDPEPVLFGAENGLTNTSGTVSLGGTLLQDTEIDGGNSFRLDISNISGLQMTADSGGSANNLFNFLPNVSTPIRLKQTTTADINVYAQLDIDSDGTLTGLRQINNSNQAGVEVLSASNSAVYVTDGTTNRKWKVTNTGHFASSIDSALATQILFIDPSTQEVTRAAQEGVVGYGTADGSGTAQTVAITLDSGTSFLNHGISRLLVFVNGVHKDYGLSRDYTFSSITATTLNVVFTSAVPAAASVKVYAL